jgi:hypothetical protein
MECTRVQPGRGRPRSRCAAGAKLAIAIITSAALLAIGAEAAWAALPATDDGIHLALAFDYRVSDPTSLAPVVDYVWGGSLPSAGGPTTDAYMPFDLEWDSLAGGPLHTLAWFRANHPDWIVYKCDRTTPAAYPGIDPNVEPPLDFTNPAVRAYQWSVVDAALKAGYGGVAWDDFTFTNFESRCGVYRDGSWTPLGYQPQGQGDPKLISDMVAWARDMYTRVHTAFPDRRMSINSAVTLSGIDALKQVAPYLDNNFDEGGFTFFGARRLADGEWQQEVDWMEYLNSLGKAHVLDEIFPCPNDAAVSSDDIEWALSNYLLTRDSQSYTYIYGGTGGYGSFVDRPVYHAPVGHPVSGRFQIDGLQLRDYSNGLAIVNPSSTSTIAVTLGDGYSDLSGQSVTSITLPPVSGAVLLGPSATVPSVRVVEPPAPASAPIPNGLPTTSAAPPTPSGDANAGPDPVASAPPTAPAGAIAPPSGSGAEIAASRSEPTARPILRGHRRRTRIRGRRCAGHSGASGQRSHRRKLPPGSRVCRRKAGVRHMSMPRAVGARTRP